MLNLGFASAWVSYPGDRFGDALRGLGLQGGEPNRRTFSPRAFAGVRDRIVKTEQPDTGPAERQRLASEITDTLQGLTRVVDSQRSPRWGDLRRWDEFCRLLSPHDGERRRTWLEHVADHGKDPGRSVAYCSVMRDVFGDPFDAKGFRASPDWRTPTVLTLAKAIVDRSDYGSLPVLAGALHDAGCDNETMLAYCRGPGYRGPGCWVLDCILDW
jgi:hypothetical protein